MANLKWGRIARKKLKSTAFKQQPAVLQCKQIYDVLIAAGAPACVARDWSNEPIRRERDAAKVAAKKEALTKEGFKKVTPRGTPFRRIIFELTVPIERWDWDKEAYVATGKVRDIMFHATKGWRSQIRVA
jgi:hypothetical protein